MLSERKFTSLPICGQHKIGAQLLREVIGKSGNLEQYRMIEKWMGLPPVQDCFEALSDRFHTHVREGFLDLPEYELLEDVRLGDRISDVPFAPISIYLDNLRSAHNVGSILRTVEAFRLGKVFLGGNTPGLDNEKVQRRSMGAAPFVTVERCPDLSLLPRPFIAIETSENALPLYDYTFPKSFTLLFGNEEYGLSKALLEQADQILHIPLLGMKNSINVGCAFAIVAAEIQRNRVHVPIVNKTG
ncbi:MAG: tRNA (guanosine(18)-2'-O)-methyltransferase [Chlamydiia bacterium]|nr:tRNA (guanosine(18)-2'-O)-methyltransferase [Chlamydiia bacterium]